METRPRRRRSSTGAAQEARYKIRREVLDEIRRAWFDGSYSALARELVDEDGEPVTAGYVNNVIAGRRPFGEKAADMICSSLAIPLGSLDTPLSGPLGPRESRPFERRPGEHMLSDTNLMRALKLQQIPEGPEKRIIDSAIDAALDEQRRRDAELKQRERKQ